MNNLQSDEDSALRAEVQRSARESAGSTDALEASVLARWQAQHRPQPAPQWRQVLAGTGGRGGKSGSRWWTGSVALLVASALLLALWWTQRQDAALEELMQLDVLSQIAVGEL